jgi:hypothetical protein
MFGLFKKSEYPYAVIEDIDSAVVFKRDELDKFFSTTGLDHKFEWIQPAMMRYAFRTEADRNFFLLHFPEDFEKTRW